MSLLITNISPNDLQGTICTVRSILLNLIEAFETVCDTATKRYMQYLTYAVRGTYLTAVPICYDDVPIPYSGEWVPAIGLVPNYNFIGSGSRILTRLRSRIWIYDQNYNFLTKSCKGGSVSFLYWHFGFLHIGTYSPIQNSAQV